MSKEEKRKPGRPKSGQPLRTNRVEVLLTDAELKTIAKAAGGVSLSSYMRGAVLDRL